MNFSDALLELKKGRNIARKIWNGKTIALVGDEQPPHIGQTMLSGFIEPWVVRQYDLFADDWYVVEKVYDGQA